MQPTPYPTVNQLLNELLSKLQTTLGDNLVGVYLYGSLVTGGFEEDISDIDLLAATARDIDDEPLEDLRTMHADFVQDHPRWDNRIEVAYLSLAALHTFKAQISRLAIISPGEPLHIVDAGRDWLMNWYMVREVGRTLFGPPPSELIAAVSKEEFIEAVRDHAQWWGARINDIDEGHYQSYAILTMCRALYTHRFGEQVSKHHAADWMQGAFPEWSSLIQEALLRRTGQCEHEGDPRAPFPDAPRFVQFVSDQIVRA